jgi:hypothetical protein
VWALGYDGTAWSYTGGWGGAHFKNSARIYPVQDKKYFYIYENQRWNPLTGFTAHGLPTDREAGNNNFSFPLSSNDNGQINLAQLNILALTV